MSFDTLPITLSTNFYRSTVTYRLIGLRIGESLKMNIGLVVTFALSLQAVVGGLSSYLSSDDPNVSSTPQFTAMVVINFLAIIGMIKVLFLLMWSTKVKSLIVELGKYWPSDEHIMDVQEERLLKTYNKSVANLFTGWNIVTTSVVILCVFDPIWNYMIQGDDADVTLKLPLLNSYPFNTSDNTIMYLIAYTIQCYNIFAAIVMSLQIHSVFVWLVNCLCYLLEVVTFRLNVFESTPGSVVTMFWLNNETREVLLYKRNECDHELLYMNEIIKLHQVILKLSKQLEVYYGPLVLIMFVISSFVVCADLFIVTMLVAFNESVKFVSGVCMLLTIDYIISSYGDTLQDKSEKVAYAAFTINKWISRGRTYKQTQSFIIMRANDPCKLRMVKFSIISRKTFTSMLSASWSYFMILKSVYDRT